MEYFYYIPIGIVGCSDGLFWKPFPSKMKLLKARKREKAFSEALLLYKENRTNNLEFSQDIFSYYCENEKISDDSEVKKQLQEEYPRKIHIVKMSKIKSYVMDLETSEIKLISSKDCSLF